MVRKFSLNILMDLHIFKAVYPKMMCLEYCMHVCMCVWMCALLAPELLEGFYSSLVLRVIGWCVVNVNILALKWGPVTWAKK